MSLDEQTDLTWNGPLGEADFQIDAMLDFRSNVHEINRMLDLMVELSMHSTNGYFRTKRAISLNNPVNFGCKTMELARR
uniref:Uncharacterized protein n=1 Tax=Romanomermis culicivorax TaxID=13658 RepID=A0A915I4W0_ROMCU